MIKILNRALPLMALVAVALLAGVREANAQWVRSQKAVMLQCA
ncbi:hypothetical protein BH23PLA1_BH23PLA1_30900 [soil metagenome]